MRWPLLMVFVAAACGRVNFDPTVVAGGDPDARTDAPVGGPTLVQQAMNYASSSANLSVTLVAPPAAGNVLVMIGGNPKGPLGSVTGAGAIWTLAARSLDNADVEIWFGVTDGSSSTVTLGCPGSTEAMSLVVGEWAGLVTPNPLDLATAVGGTTSPASPGSITTTHDHDLLLLAVGAYTPDMTGTPSPGSWTGLTGTSGAMTSQHAWYQVVTATGSFAPQVSSTGGTWDAAIAALRIAP